jgi:poly(3-hydroxybutyrate) depolymerase
LSGRTEALALRPLSDTITRLAKLNAGLGAPETASRLSTLSSFGSNPGALGAKLHIPANLPSGAGLVVVLHGCTQTAAAYDHASGWSRLADEYGFAVLYPEQSRANNADLCFNWFVPGDVVRGGGEVDCTDDRSGVRRIPD